MLREKDEAKGRAQKWLRERGEREELGDKMLSSPPEVCV